MKVRNAVVSSLSILIAMPVMAFETYWTDAGKERTLGSHYEFKSTDQKEAKIAYLTKMLEQQQKLYEQKVSYLEYELKKSKERLVEKSLNNEKTQEYLENKFAEESAYLKRELVARTKTVMEYQRQLEKIKPSEDMKNLIKVNTELAIEVRKSTDQLALIQLKQEADKPHFGGNAGGARMPASVEK